LTTLLTVKEMEEIGVVRKVMFSTVSFILEQLRAPIPESAEQEGEAEKDITEGIYKRRV